MTTTTTDQVEQLLAGWTFHDHTGTTSIDAARPGIWTGATHNACGRTEYALHGRIGLQAVISGHSCQAPELDPRLQLDLGPVAEMTIGSVALFVEGLPFGLFDERPSLRMLAERLQEGLASHLDSPEPPVDPTGLAAARGALYARRLAGTLRADEPIMISWAEVVEAGALPTGHHDEAALGVAWCGPADLPSIEICAAHLGDLLSPDDWRPKLDGAALGLVVYDSVDCQVCRSAGPLQTGYTGPEPA